MSNHEHLFVETPEPNLSAGMQYLNGSYTGYFNRRFGRCGQHVETNMSRYQRRLRELEQQLLRN